MVKEYRYQCRECPPDTRRECIQRAHISPGIKRIIIQAFESRTDTQNTWDFLQPACLLVHRDQVRSALRPKAAQLGLIGRLQNTKQVDAGEPESPPIVKPSPELESSSESPEPPMVEASRRRRPEKAPRSQDVRLQRQNSEATHPGSRAEDTPRASSKVAGAPLSTRTVIRYPIASRPQPVQVMMPGPRILVAQATGRRILLPKDDELVLGRFDPVAKVAPDIDLTFEDRHDRGISRRHTRIVGWRGRYVIADLGSHNGTWVNGDKLSLDAEQELHIGDEVRLGSCVLFFDRVPALWDKPFPAGQYFMYVTATGRFIPLPEKSTINLGRTDSAVGFRPDIDLSDEGDVASVVSRRHARLIRDGGQLLVEDVGSANKTRVNGRPVPIGIRVPIVPGQHLWLGGCNLALDLVETPDQAVQENKN